MPQSELTDLSYSIFLCSKICQLCFKHVPNYYAHIKQSEYITFTAEHKTNELLSMQKCHKTTVDKWVLRGAGCLEFLFEG